MMMWPPQQQQHHRSTTAQSNNNNNRALSPDAFNPSFVTAAAEARLQHAFQSDLEAAKPLFTARQIATRHLSSGFQLFAGKKDDAQLFTDRMLTLAPRGRSAGASVSPVVVDYKDDTGHGKRTRRAVLLDRKQEHRDDAKAFVERHGISILGRMQQMEAAGSAANALPGILTRKNRAASPTSSHTHIKGMGIVEEGKADGSKLHYTRRVHPAQAHATNLTRTLLPMRNIKTPCASCLSSPPRSPRGVRRGPKYSVDTHRVLSPDMIPFSREPRLKSLRPTESLGQGMTIKDGAPQWEWKGAPKSFHQKTDPFGGGI